MPLTLTPTLVRHLTLTRHHRTVTLALFNVNCLTLTLLCSDFLLVFSSDTNSS